MADEQQQAASASGTRAPLRFTEFVVLVAAMMSTQAIAVDAMLPALPTIVSELQVANANHGQWVVTAYLIGVGIGQLFWGLLSDRFGRRPVLLIGLVAVRRRGASPAQLAQQLPGTARLAAACTAWPRPAWW